MSIELTIMRDTDTITTFKPDGTSNQQKKIMGDNIISLQFTLNQIINFNIGDWCLVFGEKYFLARAPSITKTSTYKYVYGMQMISFQYELSKAQYMFYDNLNNLRDSDFSLTGNANFFIDLLVKNVNRLNPGWSKGAVITTDTKTLTFSKVDCGAALAQIATAFETEFYVQGMTVNLDKLHHATPYSFHYGQGKGLYEIKRQEVDNTSVITRLYAYGGEKNLPPGYLSTRLRLPGGYDYLIHNLTWTVAANGANPAIFTDITFSWTAPLNPDVNNIYIRGKIVGNLYYTDSVSTSATSIVITVENAFIYEFLFTSRTATAEVASLPTIIVNPAVAQSVPLFVNAIALPYLEENTGLFGVIESNYINDEIYPHRTGVVTAVDATIIYIFSDSTIDFDVNTQLLPGITAKVTFTTGQLSGYTFDISAFDNSLKQFTILKNKDEKSLDIPSTLIKPIIGDEYVLTDIEMPLAYINAAEQDLQVKAQAYLDLYSSPIYQYSIICDPKWFRAKVIKMGVGDVVFLTDAELQISKYIRVISLTKSLIDEFEYSLELGDVVPVGTFQQIVANQNITQSGVDSVTHTVNNNSLLEGYFIGPAAASVAAMKGLYVDSSNKIWKAP